MEKQLQQEVACQDDDKNDDVVVVGKAGIDAADLSSLVTKNSKTEKNSSKNSSKKKAVATPRTSRKKLENKNITAAAEQTISSKITDEDFLSNN